MTNVLLRLGRPAADGWRVTAPETVLLARLLSTAVLIAATTEYAEVIRRRLARRALARERVVFEQHGLHGLVRVFLADAPSLEGISAPNR
jgi:hypothetical protein